MIKSVHTEKAPKVVGPYSQAIVVGDFVYCSGQIGLDPKTGKLADGIKKQVEQVMKNLEHVLEEAKSDFKSVLKTTIYITDMKNYQVVNEVYGSYFPEHKPARATVGVSELPAGALVEIEMTAIRKFDSYGDGCACGGECGCGGH